MKVNLFSYKNYTEIIRLIEKHNRIIDFTEVLEKKPNMFTIIRHDVEFSVERAYKMAQLEELLGIKTSYLFQIRNNAYNLLSSENINLVRKIAKMGHRIGLHVHLGSLENVNKVSDYILKDIKVMEYILEIPIDRFSFHRPPSQLLKLNLNIEGKVNCYASHFFEYREQNENPNNIAIKYISDSMHRWNYDLPNEDTFKNFSKIQLLVHPYSWTIQGLDNKLNFKSLLKEKSIEMQRTIASECKHYPKDDGGDKDAL